MTGRDPYIERFGHVGFYPAEIPVLVAELRADPVMLMAARAELARLSAMRGGTPLIDCCSASKVTHAALTEALRAVDGGLDSLTQGFG